MQIHSLKIQKLLHFYEIYLTNKKRGLLATIHSLIKDEDVNLWLNENNSIGRDADEKLYLIYHHLDQIEICPCCLKFKKFTLKNGYLIDGKEHRRCKKYPFNRVFQNYQEFYGIYEFRKIKYLDFIQKPEIFKLINKWKSEHLLFSNYPNNYIFPLFSYVKNENDLDQIPICKYCNKFKSSINYNLLLQK